MTAASEMDVMGVTVSHPLLLHGVMTDTASFSQIDYYRLWQQHPLNSKRYRVPKCKPI